MALAKFLSFPSPKTDVLVIQDLNADEGPGLETGDSVEIRYRSWQIEDNAIAAAVSCKHFTGNFFNLCNPYVVIFAGFGFAEASQIHKTEIYE